MYTRETVNIYIYIYACRLILEKRQLQAVGFIHDVSKDARMSSEIKSTAQNTKTLALVKLIFFFEHPVT